jgi:probable phosphoglycerate mutase
LVADALDTFARESSPNPPKRRAVSHRTSESPRSSRGARTIVHLIRHADAVPEPAAEIDPAATYDALGLSFKGMAQAAALARRLAQARHPPAAVYASATRRARETAGALAAALALDVGIDDRLREIYLGDLSPGDVPAPERAEAIRSRLATLGGIAARDGSWDALPDAEPAAAVRARMAGAVGAIVARHPDATVALVSHAGAINAYIAGIVGVKRDFFFPTGNTSLSSIAFRDGVATLIRLNDTAHLESRPSG